MEWLAAINIICLVIIVLIVGVNTFFLYLTRLELNRQKMDLVEKKAAIKNMNEDLRVVMDKLSSGLKWKIESNTMSILDLEEFRGLSKEKKRQYKEYVLGVLAPALIAEANKVQYTDADMRDMTYEILKNLNYP
jgi:hypothetical protein